MQRSYGAAAWALLRHRFTHVLYVGGAVFLIDFLRIWPQVPADADLLGWIFPEFVTNELVSATGAATVVTIAQAAPLRGWRRALVMAAAGPAVAAFVAGSSWLMFRYLDWGFILRENIVASFASYAMATAWTWWLVTVALTFFYLAQEREVRLAREAREAELVRVEAQRTVMATRLDVMRARVEPEFLFGALAEVRKLYQEDREAGDAMIDALIAYLRAALPQMRGQGSTVQREVDLAAAYAAVLQVPRGDALALSQSVEEHLREVPLAPMLLLPLAQAAFEGGDAGLRTRFAIDAVGNGGGIDIVLTLDGGRRPPAWSQEGCESSRRTLEAYYPGHARFEFTSIGARHRARLAVDAAAIAIEPATDPSPSGSGQSTAGTAAGAGASASA